MQNNDLIKNMEFILKQLNAEWERSGEAKKEDGVVGDPTVAPGSVQWAETM